MKKLLIVLLVLNFESAFSFSKEANVEMVFLNKKKVEKLTTRHSFNANCKLIEEQVNGITEIKYEYDSLNRLTAKLYVRLKFAETFKYDQAGFLIETINDSPNAFNISYKYKNGLLISKSKKYNSLSLPVVETYEYNAKNELIKKTETYISTGTITEFDKGKAIKMTNPHINYELNNNGLVVKSMAINGLNTINTYQYDDNDMLVLNEVFEKTNKKLMYTAYQNSKIKKTKMGDDLIENHKGIPAYKNPYGDNSFYVSSITNYSTNTKTGLPEKVYEKNATQTFDNTGKILNDNSGQSVVYVYAGCD
jgi:hypothetical protein